MVKTVRDPVVIKPDSDLAALKKTLQYFPDLPGANAPPADIIQAQKQALVLMCKKVDKLKYLLQESKSAFIRLSTQTPYMHSQNPEQKQTPKKLVARQIPLQLKLPKLRKSPKASLKTCCSPSQPGQPTQPTQTAQRLSPNIRKQSKLELSKSVTCLPQRLVSLDFLLPNPSIGSNDFR